MDSQISRSEKKRRAKGVEQLVHELAALSANDIVSLPCDMEVRDEIRSAKKLKGGAKKRQLKHVTKLLRDRPVEELYDFLVKKKGSALKQQREFQEIEHLRNVLLNDAVARYDDIMHQGGYFAEPDEPVDFLEDSDALRSIAARFPDIDRALLKNNAVQFARTRNRKFSRELFRIMKAASEKAQFA
jgi:ribosome-associated protein